MTLQGNAMVGKLSKTTIKPYSKGNIVHLMKCFSYAIMKITMK